MAVDMQPDDATQSVNTAKVGGRRELRFESIAEIRDDVESLLESKNRVLGNWTEAQIYEHLAIGMSVIFEPDKFTFKPPFMLKLFGPIIKGFMLKGKMKPGFKLPPDVQEFFSPADDAEKQTTGKILLEYLDRIEAADDSAFPARHVLFGKFTRQNWIDLTLRHCELHLSFIVPG